MEMQYGHNWKGGRTLSGEYPRPWKPNHPKARSGGYIDEHIFLTEKGEK